MKFRHALLLFALGACSRAVSAPSPVDAFPDRETAEIYRTVAESMYVSTTHRPVVIAAQTLDTTCSRIDCPSLAKRWALESPLWWAHGDSVDATRVRDNLLARAAQRLDLRPISLGQPFLLTADSTDLPGFGADTVTWTKYRKSHRDAAGVIRFSPVGVDDSKRTAIVFVQWLCGPECGHTISVYLTRDDMSQWAIAEVLLTSRLIRSTGDRASE